MVKRLVQTIFLTLILLTICLSFHSGNYVANADYSYTFHGPYDEENGQRTTETVGDETLFESYTTDGALKTVYGPNWYAQTFNSTTPFLLTQVALHISRYNYPGTAIMSIRATNGTGFPTGSDLTSVSFDGNSLATSEAWVSISLSSGYTINESTTYAIVLRAPAGDVMNLIDWESDITPSYGGGQGFVSTSSGAVWATNSPANDFLFKTYGYLEVIGSSEVTAYFTDGTSSETFTVNGTYAYSSSTQPEYFVFEDGRQYWVGDSENATDIYVFEGDTILYTLSFIDLVGALDTYPFVEAQRYVNGTLHTVEKRQVDVEKKIVMYLVNGAHYTIIIKDGSTYTYGDLLMTATTTIQLTLKGVAFPKETLLTYKYVRIYGRRVFADPNGNITITYQDTLNLTVSVDIYINFKNGTNVYNATETADSFVHTWASAENDTDYAVVVNMNHTQYGTWTWKQYFPRSMSTAPWGLDFLGTSLPFATSILVPAFIVLFVAGCFSVINAEVGAFMAVIVAAILTYLGWIAIPSGLLLTAFCLAILMGLIYAKRRVLY